MSIRVKRIEVDSDVAAPALPETKVILEPRPPKGWEQGLHLFAEDMPEVAFTLTDDVISFQSMPEIRERAIEAVEERIGRANSAYALALSQGMHR